MIILILLCVFLCFHMCFNGFTLFLDAKVVLEHDNYPFKKLGGFVNKVTACDHTVLVFQIVYDKLKWIGSGEYQMTQLFLVLFTK